jgi:PAS domain S-box-containing protein
MLDVMRHRLILALLLPFLAAGLQWLLWDFIQPYVWFLFFPAAFFSAWLGGVVGGVAGTLSCALLVWYLFMPPALSFQIANASQAFSLLVFLVMGGLFTWLFEQLRRAQVSSDALSMSVFEQAAVGIAQVAPDGRWLRVNRKLCEILGYTQDELLAKTFQDITHPDDLDKDLGLVQRVLRQEIDNYGLDKRYLRKDGSYLWARLTVSLVRKPDGTPDYFISVLEDISLRKQAEVDLRESESRLNRALAAADAGVWEWDVLSNLNHWSDEVFRLYGLEPGASQASYDAWLGTIHPEDRAAAVAATSDALARGAELDFEWRVLLPDGPERWLLSRGQPRFDEQGRLVRYLGIVMDITARKTQERSLARNLETLRLATDDVGVGTWYWDMSTETLEWSECSRVLLALPPGKPPSFEHFFSVVHPDDRDRVDSLIRDAVTRRSDYLAEYRVVKPDGSVRWLEAPGRVYLHADGTLRGMGGNIRDITERKAIETELKGYRTHLEQIVEQRTGQLTRLAAELGESEARFREVANAAPVLIWMSGLDKLCYFFNQSWLDFTGRTLDQELGDGWAEGVHPDDQDRRLEAYVRSFDARRPFSVEYRLRHRSGEYRWLLDQGVPRFDGNGNCLGYIGACIDIEAIKLAEAEREAARQAAESASQVKSTFLANMSHEIRTPMNAILGFAYLLGRADNLTADQRERLDKIAVAGEHLLSIINDILDLSKIESGKMVLEQMDFSLGGVLDGVGSLISESARAKGLAVSLDMDGVPPLLHGDPTRLRQALLNYAGNAVKFTERGGITIAAQLLASSGDQFLVRFEVRDTGMGIPEDKLSGLFQAFQQVDASTNRKYGGTGLGLAITHRLAGLMGGETGVESRLGQGSTFWLTARLGRGRAGEAPAPAPLDRTAEAVLRQRHAGRRILLVEDEPVNRELATFLLEEVALAVDPAADGREAVEKAARQPYDLILMDMQMPVMGGLDATRAIRALPGGGKVPIVAMTANAFEEDRLRCLEAGMDDFLSKPVDPDMMYATLLRWLER